MTLVASSAQRSASALLLPSRRARICPSPSGRPGLLGCCTSCAEISFLAEASDTFVRRSHNVFDSPIVNVYLARERARRGDHDSAIPLMRAAVDHLFREGQPR